MAPETRAFPFSELERYLEECIRRIASARIIAAALIDARQANKCKDDGMSITGADAFAQTLRERLSKTKARIVALHERKNALLARGDAVAELAERVCKEAEAEVTELEGELRQLSNFPPADGDAAPKG